MINTKTKSVAGLAVIISALASGTASANPNGTCMTRDEAKAIIDIGSRTQVYSRQLKESDKDPVCRARNDEWGTTLMELATAINVPTSQKVDLCIFFKDRDKASDILEMLTLSLDRKAYDSPCDPSLLPD